MFTAFRQTLDALAAEVARAGIAAAVYHGSLSRREKDAAVAAFAGDAPVLLSTESAGEGRNLQFCHVMINVDLPWNPMQIEQRLGRLHRVGQQHDVLLTNLVARGTIEQRILRVLETKINLFELVVGELDMILGRVDDDFDFETADVRRTHPAADDSRVRSASWTTSATRWPGPAPTISPTAPRSTSWSERSNDRHRPRARFWLRYVEHRRAGRGATATAPW